jgi:UDP-perosamine 4-acetyltransferase
MTEKPVIVIGSGGHAKVLIAALQELKRKILFATDSDPVRIGSELLGIPIAGNDSLIEQQSPDEVELVNGIGSTGSLALRYRISCRWKDAGYSFATVIHPTAFVARSVQVGPGCQIMAGVVIQPGTVIGGNSIVNTRAAVDHDCQIGEYVHISPGVVLCGSVTVGDQSHVGAGSTVIQGIQIGRQVLVGAGAVVVNDVPDSVMVVGVPAKVRHHSILAPHTGIG